MAAPANLFIIAAPSGAGKSSLISALLQHDPAVRLSISYTTRPPRPGEADGREYHFVSREAFEAMIASGDFLEHANVYGNLYGTSKSWIEQTLAGGLDVILEIDWQGAKQVRRLFTDSVGIYILPPSLEVLEQRLRGRQQDKMDVISARLAAAQDDMSHLGEFDYVIINNDFQEALADLGAIFRAARLTREKQQVRHAELIHKLLLKRV
jgi:guanylate kinase